MSFSDPLQREIWAVVQELNRAWTLGHPERLAEWFHPQMVAVTPGEPRRLECGADCVAGWTAYAEAARIFGWKERNALVRVHGEAAVVAYTYEIDVELGGVRRLLQGRDLLFLVREEGRWRVVADQFSPMPS